MRLLALGLLLLMAAVFLVTTLWGGWPGAGYVRAFSEAAMVGALADWFAVTALFRRPLGLPIPHTAIIPRNKDRIGDALGRFIVENFLAPEVVDARLRKIELAGWGAAWLAEPRNAERLAGRVAGGLSALIRAMPPGAMREIAGAAALAGARSIPAAPALGALISAAWREETAGPLIRRGAELLSAYLDDNQDVVLEKVQSQSWRWMPKWVDKAIAKKINAGLVQLLQDVQQPDHPWREKLNEVVAALADKLAHDPETIAKGEEIKQSLLEDPRLLVHAASVWETIEARLKTQGLGDDAVLREKLAPLIADLGRWLASDRVMQRALNRSARALFNEVLAPRRQEIGRFVANVVHGWDARSVVDRLELQVGPDLQFIRINGTLVGGLVGLGLYIVGRLLGAP
jgi:uncharacterized membrane-anchored protein YjiN (DUF445 family)